MMPCWGFVVLFFFMAAWIQSPGKLPQERDKNLQHINCQHEREGKNPGKRHTKPDHPVLRDWNQNLPSHQNYP